MSSEPDDQFLLQIRGVVAEYERTLLSERMCRGRLPSTKRDSCCHGRTPLWLQGGPGQAPRPVRGKTRRGQGRGDRLTEAYLGEAIPLAEYQRRRQNLEQRDEALPAQERQLRARSHQHMELAGKVGSLEDFCERARGGLADATFQQRRKLVELLIDRVIVTDDEVEIRYVIPTSPESEHVRFCHMRSDYLGDPQARQVREIRTSRQLAKVHLG
jgi:hypothetical protein